MKRFGILQAAFPARSSKLASSANYQPSRTWQLFHAAGCKYNLQVLFFRSEDVDFTNRRVHAWSSSSKDGKSGWKREWHPLPDVVYENYPLGARGAGMGVAAVKRRFIQSGIPTFNPMLFDKAALDRILSKSSSARIYLPPSKTVSQVSDVTRFLKQYRMIYLKPVNGSQGTGILQIKLLQNQSVQVDSDKFAAGKSLHKTFSYSGFESFIGPLIKRRRYLVQKGLQLLQKNGQKIDFRVVVHRSADGKWHCAGIRPKLGKAGAIVTNSHAGGSKTTWEELSAWARQTGTPLPDASKLEKAALASASYLTRFRPTLSHLGIDVAVDQNQHVYVLDINIRPGRDLLTYGMLLKVTDYTAGFASYLAGKRG